MPSDINLLPDDLRRAEEDEQRRQSHRSDGERRYSAGTPKPAEQPSRPAEPLVPVPLAPASPPPRTGWFTKLLGRRGKAVTEAPSGGAPVVTVTPSSPPAKPEAPVVPAPLPKPVPVQPKPTVPAEPARSSIRPQPWTQAPAQAPDVHFAATPEPLPAQPQRQPWSWQAMLGAIRRRLGKPDDGSALPALEVNLVPHEVVVSSPTNVWPLIGVVGGACALVAATYLSLGFLVSQQQAEAAEVEAKLETLITDAEAKAAAVESIAHEVESVRAVRTLVADHVRWTRFFRWLEEHTLPDVYYAGFRGDITGEFALVASTKDFVTLSQQLLVFQKAPEVLTVNVGEASRGGDSWVNFNLSFELSPSLLTSR